MKNKQVWAGIYTAQCKIGKGGNAVVFRVRDKRTSVTFALKQLQYRSVAKKNNYEKCGEAANVLQEKQSRFINEIDIAEKYAKTIPGILPIIQSNKQEYWYVMPEAVEIDEHIKRKDLKIIINGIIQLSTTLVSLHEKDVTHRDIKPANIYFYDGRFCLGDFGLVDFPENSDNLTKSNKGLGPVFTMAPEMRRNPKTADGKKADVYSLAKTMWILVTGNKKGFDGPYSYSDSVVSLRFAKNLTGKHLAEIEELLKEATDNDPDKRPTMKEFEERLKNWIVVSADIDKSQLSDWTFLRKQIFGQYIPNSAKWNDRNSIINILNCIAVAPVYNHMLFSDNGGVDLMLAEPATEEGCICVVDTLLHHLVLKPLCLHYEGYDDTYEWNYFLLELAVLNPILNTKSDMGTELLVEDVPGHYVDGRYEQYGVYDYDSGEKLPEGSRLVKRYLKGKFLIVMKNGPYNQIPGTYDGRHGDCDSATFRLYMDTLHDVFYKIRSEIISKKSEECDSVFMKDDALDARILNSTSFNSNPFKKENSEINKGKVVKSDTKQLNRFIKDHISTWDFSTLLYLYVNEDETSYIKFYYVLETNSLSLANFTVDKERYLCTDGIFRELSTPADIDCFYVTERVQAVALKEKIVSLINEKLAKSGLALFSDSEFDVDIDFLKCGKPKYLFTKQDIEKEIHNADDRVRNQLVIDEAGYAKIIRATEESKLFPVRLESWDAGNAYVGKYAPNIQEVAECNYMMALDGWLAYLKTGKRQYRDYCVNHFDEVTFLNEIKKFY